MSQADGTRRSVAPPRSRRGYEADAGRALAFQTCRFIQSKTVSCRETIVEHLSTPFGFRNENEKSVRKRDGLVFFLFNLIKIACYEKRKMFSAIRERQGNRWQSPMGKTLPAPSSFSNGCRNRLFFFSCVLGVASFRTH
jgi:hypothetical protein